MYKQMHIYIYMFTYVYIYIYTYTCIYIYMYMYVHMYIHTYIHTYVQICIYLCVCIFVCVCVTVYILPEASMWLKCLLDPFPVLRYGMSHGENMRARTLSSACASTTHTSVSCRLHDSARTFVSLLPKTSLRAPTHLATAGFACAPSPHSNDVTVSLRWRCSSAVTESGWGRDAKATTLGCARYADNNGAYCRHKVSSVGGCSPVLSIAVIDECDIVPTMSRRRKSS